MATFASALCSDGCLDYFMKHTLLFLYGLLIVFLLGNPINTYAQGEPKRSRLDIKPKAKSTTSSTQIHPYFYPKAEIAREVKVNRSTAVNEYYRTLLRNRPKSTGSSKTEQPLAPLAVVASESTRDFDDSSSSEKLFVNDKISVSNLYPNPANDHIEVEYAVAANAGEAKITLYSPLGMQMGGVVLEPGERKQRIATSHLPNNIYFYQLSLEGKTLITKKLLVRHQ